MHAAGSPPPSRPHRQRRGTGVWHVGAELLPRDFQHVSHRCLVERTHGTERRNARRKTDLGLEDIADAGHRTLIEQRVAERHRAERAKACHRLAQIRVVVQQIGPQRLNHVVALERDRRAFATLRRSGELVRGRWIRVGSLVGVSGVTALLLGPLLGAILIFLTDLPLAMLNIVAGVVYALSMPFVALVTAYVYFDARARFELEPVEHVDELPSEIALDSA